MHSAKLKVKRANSHINQMVEISSPLAKNLYEIKLIREGDMFYLTFNPKQPIPESFALLAGDAVHNLRCALDHLLWALYETSTGERAPSYLSFPFDKNWKSLEAQKSYKAIQRAFPDAATLIRDTIKPTADRNYALWALNILDRFDKHRFLLPSVTVIRVKETDMGVENATPVDVLVSGDVSGPIKIFASDRKIRIEDNIKLTLDIRFPDTSAVFKNEPFIPTLFNTSKSVTETLNCFETFLTNFR